MITFKQFLLEDDEQNVRARPINEKQAIGWIRENSIQYAKNFMRGEKTKTKRAPGQRPSPEHSNPHTIFRGLSDRGDDFLYGDPFQGEPRQSKNTTNEYTLLIDNLDMWSNFPKRSRSFVCTTTESFAEGFGEPYLVFPSDQAAVGVAPKDDMWNSFPKIREAINSDVEEFNRMLRDIQTASGQKPNDTNWRQFYEQLKNIQTLIKQEGVAELSSNTRYNKTHKFLEFIDQSKMSFLEAIAHLLEPTSNGFDIKPANRFKVQGIKEVWFSAPAVFVNTHNTDVVDFVDRVLNM